MTIEDAYKLSCYKELMQLDSNGNVYLTRHIETGSIFVRKTLPAYTKELFKALISYKKNNPASHIPAIIETFADDEKIHVIEEYIEGRTLGQIMDEDPLTEKEIAHIIIELCDILSGLHSVDPPIIHRDIKPSNLIINTDGSLYLIDFDSAKQYNEDRNEDTVLLGTRGYAAPEQYGFGQSTPRTDIYGIGALMLSLLTNTAKDGSKYNGMLRPIIDKCMSMDPNDRYADTALVKQSLILTISSGHYEQGSTPSRSKASEDEFIILRSLYKNPYLPVGFRTGTIWKMLVGSSVYVLFLYLIFTGRLVMNLNTVPQKLFFNIYWIILFIITVGYWGNYMKVRSTITPGSSPVARALLGVLIYAAIFVFTLLLALVPYALISGK